MLSSVLKERHSICSFKPTLLLLVLFADASAFLFIEIRFPLNHSYLFSSDFFFQLLNKLGLASRFRQLSLVISSSSCLLIWKKAVPQSFSFPFTFTPSGWLWTDNHSKICCTTWKLYYISQHHKVYLPGRILPSRIIISEMSSKWHMDKWRLAMLW